MGAPSFDEEELFAAMWGSGARVLVIGRRALVALGLPVLTADYDVWIHADDAALLEAALAPLGLHPSCEPEVARQRGRYVLEGDEKIDVLVARQVSTRDGVPLRFDDAWARRTSVPYSARVALAIPCIDDLILTKRGSLRPKDADDIALLEKLKRAGGAP